MILFFFAEHDDVLDGGKIVRQFRNEVINYIVTVLKGVSVSSIC